jgi:hypothetical protein
MFCKGARDTRTRAVSDISGRAPNKLLPACGEQGPDLFDRQIDFHIVIDLAEFGGRMLRISLHASACVP